MKLKGSRKTETGPVGEIMRAIRKNTEKLTKETKKKIIRSK